MSDLTQVRQQLEDALAALKRDCAALEMELTYKRKRMDALEFLLVGERVDVPSSSPAPPERDAEDNHTEMVRNIIRAAGVAGVRPRDITKRMQSNGIPVKTQFASNVLWRLKNNTKEITEFGKRYYWKGFEPAQAKTVGGVLVSVP